MDSPIFATPPDPYAFAQEVLRMYIENFVHHAVSPGPVFFERGVLDALCSLDRVTPLNESELSMWLAKYLYFPRVFVLPPWKAIYVNDAERDHTFEHAESVNRIVQEWYLRWGYQVLEEGRGREEGRTRPFRNGETAGSHTVVSWYAIPGPSPRGEPIPAFTAVREISWRDIFPVHQALTARMAAFSHRCAVLPGIRCRRKGAAGK